MQRCYRHDTKFYYPDICPGCIVEIEGMFKRMNDNNDDLSRLEAKIKLQEQRIESLLKAVDYYGDAENWSHDFREPVFLAVGIKEKAYAVARETLARDKELTEEK